MTQYIKIPVTEFAEALQSKLKCVATQLAQLACCKLIAIHIHHLRQANKMQTEHDYILDHYGLDNWQAEWGNGDIERDIIVEYSESDVLYKFDYRVLMDGKDITATLNKGNRKTFESLMEKEYLDRTAQLRDHAYD